MDESSQFNTRILGDMYTVYNGRKTLLKQLSSTMNEFSHCVLGSSGKGKQRNITLVKVTLFIISKKVMTFDDKLR